MNSEEINARFNELRTRLKLQFGRTPGVDAILFLIGMNELGKGPVEFSREDKMNLLHIAHCKIFSQSGYYELERTDEEGWPHYKTLKQYPVMGLEEQEIFLKQHILLYFETIDYYENNSIKS